MKLGFKISIFLSWCAIMWSILSSYMTENHLVQIVPVIIALTFAMIVWLMTVD